MKYLLFAILLLPGHRYDAIQLVQEEHKLNSGSRPGGTSRALVPLHIPAHTDYVVYSIAASAENPLHDLRLHTQISERVKEGGAHMTLGLSLLDKLTKAPADGVTDVLIIPDSLEAVNYVHHINEPHCNEEYSRRGIANAVVGIPLPYCHHDTTLYMVLRNPTAFSAQYVTVEAEALKRVK